MSRTTAHYALVLTAAAVLLSARSLSAAPRFGGGMTAYFNYADMPVSEGRIYGLGWGLGGILNCGLSDNFRIGCMGSTYRLDYSNPGARGSYIDMGYGGLCAEYCIPVTTGRCALGLMLGGGEETNLHIWTAAGGDSISARYGSFGMMIGAPMISYEHALTKAIFALVRIDYLVGFHNGTFETFGSPGLRVGIIFNK